MSQGYDGHAELGVEEIDGFHMIKRMAAEVQVMFNVLILIIDYSLESIAGTSFDAAETGPQAHNFMNHSL